MMSPDGIGQLLRAVREAAGRTREEQAQLMQAALGKPFDAANIKRWETEKRLPIPEWFSVIHTAYGIAEQEIRRAVAASRQSRRAAAAAALLIDEEDDVERRQFLGAALAAGTVTAPWGRLAAALSRPRVDTATAEQLIARTAEMFTTEEHLPARLLAVRLASHLETLTSLIPHAGEHRRALTVAAGETAALAGWAAYDTGDHAVTRHYYETAAMAGREAGHPPVVALAMGYASYAVPADQARGMLAAAQDQVRGPGYATARSWLAAREAEEAAAMGDRDAAVRALDRAATTFDYGQPGELAWTSFFRQARLDSCTLAAYTQIQHPDLADTAELALAHLGDDDSKIRLAVLHDVARAYVAAGELEQGAQVGRRFLEAAVETPTTMGRQRMTALADQLPTHNSAARSLTEDIRVALAS